MRKLHEVLPLIRPRLFTGPEGPGHRIRVCYAAHSAAAAGLITDEEDDAISERVMAEIAPLTLLQTWLIDRGLVGKSASPYSPEYIAARDAWLDNLQRKLEAEEA